MLSSHVEDHRSSSQMEYASHRQVSATTHAGSETSTTFPSAVTLLNCLHQHAWIRQVKCRASELIANATSAQLGYTSAIHVGKKDRRQIKNTNDT